MRRRLYPMPVEALADHPELIAMPAAGAGIVLRLVLHFWTTECRPLPVADHELRAIARAHAPTWRTWKPNALRVLADIMPELEAYRAERERKGTTIRFASRAGGETRKAMLAANARQEAAPAALVTVEPLPVREANPEPRAERPRPGGPPKARTLTDAPSAVRARR